MYYGPDTKDDGLGGCRGIVFALLFMAAAVGVVVLLVVLL